MAALDVTFERKTLGKLRLCLLVVTDDPSWLYGKASGLVPRVVHDGTSSGCLFTQQPHIFERFYRVDKARSRANEQEKGSGAGHGLSIASWIAEAHGGTLRLAQSDQGGSTFVVNLPANSVR